LGYMVVRRIWLRRVARFDSEDNEAPRSTFTPAKSCTCPRMMRVDGVTYECLSPMSAGCIMHGERGEQGYVQSMQHNSRVVGKVSAGHRSGDL